MTEVLKNIVRLDIKFVDHSLDGINPYLIKGENGGRNLLIETGLNTDDCYNQLLPQLEALGAVPELTDVFVSHMHVDHCGLISRLKNSSNQIYAYAQDAVYIDNYQKPVTQWGWLTENISWTGTLPAAAVPLTDHVAVKYHPRPAVALSVLNLNDTISYGGYQFQVIDLAGHTAAHVGLWCEAKRMLFSGDHVLAEHNPNITTWNLNEDFLERYRSNLMKLRPMAIRYLFPAHGGQIEDVESNIDRYLQKMDAKQQRIRRVLAAAKHPLTAYEVAGLMYSPDKFDQIKPATKWFVCSDILAYLQHLSFQGLATSENRDHVLRFS